jgi:hypothetical protein
MSQRLFGVENSHSLRQRQHQRLRRAWRKEAVNPDHTGTKAAAHYKLTIGAATTSGLTCTTRDVLSMPDKWEYPWYAAWDLAFHCIPLALVDPDFAKQQLTLLLREWYMHPNGQIPAYEWRSAT